MPIVTINAAQDIRPESITRMILEIRDSGAKSLKCSPSNVWVVFAPILDGHSLQGDGEVTQPIVVIRAQSGRTSLEREAFIEAVAESVGNGLSVPAKHVWIHYQEMKPQDVWFDGHWSG